MIGHIVEGKWKDARSIRRRSRDRHAFFRIDFMIIISVKKYLCEKSLSLIFVLLCNFFKYIPLVVVSRVVGNRVVIVGSFT